MSKASTTDSAEVDYPAEPLEPAARLDHVTVETDGRPTECTLVPKDCDDESRTTEWITAIGDAFVSRDEIR